VLFAGIITGYFSRPVEHDTLAFVKEFGLFLFVFTIGLQLGPGFFSALRRDGLRLNTIALLIVLAGSAIAVISGWLLGLDSGAVLGILSGAVTSTPSLGAAQQTLSSVPGISDERLALPALAYAVTYPTAIAGIIGTILGLKNRFHVDMRSELEELSARGREERSTDGSPVVGAQRRDDLRVVSGEVENGVIVVTRKDVLGKTIEELALDGRRGVAVSRITRADVALTAAPDLALRFGDMVEAVGDAQHLSEAEALLGNSVKELNETQFIPLFIGIALGIIAGTVPIVIPGLPQPVQLGLAGGPLVVALVLGRLGHIGRLVFYMPVNTNLAFREFGIALFFAAVGLAAGPTFFAAVFSSTGLMWLGAGICVTVLPLIVIGLLARMVLHMNFAVLGGVLAGSMTDPPALTFMSSLARSDAPLLAYVTVYPMTTLLRILVAQIVALTLIH
jgi:AspT/YidE/YbjL antiporter-like protein